MSNILKLSPSFKDYIWGGNKLMNQYGVKDMDRVAEAWVLSAHPDGPSYLPDGTTFADKLAELGPDAVGKNCANFKDFPQLIKLIDAMSDLSVQVHPSDEYALANEGQYGKTEMWYILDCEEGAALYYGFKEDTTREAYESAIKEGRLTDILNRVPVKRGDVFFIPAGTVHAIGAGILICEIQQNSNTTYRVYDYNRRDKNGNLRPLHVEKALAVSDLKKSPALPEIPDGENVLLAECGYFEVRRLRFAGEGTITATAGSFTALTVTEGEGTLSDGESILSFRKGDTLFIPAQETSFAVTGACEMILSRAR